MKIIQNNAEELRSPATYCTEWWFVPSYHCVISLMKNSN